MTRPSRIPLRRCLPLLGVLLLVAGGLGSLDAAQAGVATATFANPAAIQGGSARASGNNSTPITVSATGTPTGSVYPSTISLSGAAGSVASMTLYLTLEHTAPDDLDVLLVSPSGRTVVLMSDVGGYADFSGDVSFRTGNGTASLPDTTTFDNLWYDATNWTGNDFAGDVWPAPAPAVADPHASLNSLIGDSPNGDWKLFVHDDQDQDGGVVSSWSLHVNTDAVPTTAGTYPSELAVSGVTGTVSDVDLTVNGISWWASSTLDAMLVAPDGRTAMVISDVGGYNAMTGVTLTLDDEASADLPELDAPTSGRYRPTNFGGGDTFPAPAPDPSTAGTPLSVFDGSNPNGTWKLFIVQDEITVPEFISAGWSLQIETSAGGDDDGAPAADHTAPWITVTAPASHAHGVRRSADLRAAASEGLRSDTVTVKNVYLRRVGSSRHIAATVSYLPASHTIVVDPSRRLRSDTRYTVVVTTDVLDAAGNRLDQDPATAGAQKKSWRFRTR